MAFLGIGANSICAGFFNTMKVLQPATGLATPVGEIRAVFARELSTEDTAAYDTFVAHVRGSHYSQARAWAAVATAGKPFVPYYFLARREGRVIGAALLLRSQLVHTLLLPFGQTERGPVCDNPDDLPDVLRELRRLTLAHGILRLSVMPYWNSKAKEEIENILRRQGFSDRQTFAGRHARTLRFDLAKIDGDEPFAHPSLAKVRQAIRRAERAGATARVGSPEDIHAFRLHYEALMQREAKSLPPQAWYDVVAKYFLNGDRRGVMFVCEHDGRSFRWSS